MPIARVYQVQVKQSLLRQMLLTDAVLGISLGLLVAWPIWYLPFDYLTKLLSMAGVVAFTAVLMQSRIDRQPIYSIFWRFIVYVCTSKKIRF